VALIHAQGVIADLAQRAVGPVLEVALEQNPVAQDGARAAGLALAAVDVGVQRLGEGEFLLRLRQRLGLGGLVRVDACPELVDDLLGLRPDGSMDRKSLTSPSRTRRVPSLTRRPCASRSSEYRSRWTANDLEFAFTTTISPGTRVSRTEYDRTRPGGWVALGVRQVLNKTDC